MWYGNIPPSPNIVIRPDAYYERALTDSSKISIQGFPGWQLMQYLPLVEDRCILYGITVFCTDGGGISGIESHFRLNSTDRPISRSIGNKKGCPINFHLSPTEHITSVWIRYCKLPFVGPFLMVSI